MPRFGKDKDSRKEELDRQAAAEVERLTRGGTAPSGMGGMPGMGGPPQMGIPSPLEMMAERVREQPRPSQRRAAPAPRRAAPPAQTFTPLPTGGVGSSFGPAGLSPGPRSGAAAAPPPSAFGGEGYDEDPGGAVTGPPVYNAAEPDEDEEMSITEMALIDHAARTGHRPEDLVMQYDASSAEEMRDAAMRSFYERQSSRRPVASGNNPFGPAAMRAGPPGAAPPRRVEDPRAAGGALAERLAARRRREEEEARRARGEPEPGALTGEGPAPGAADGALARVLARRRQSLGLDAESAPEPPAPAPSPAPGRRHAQQRTAQSPGLRGASLVSVAGTVPNPDEAAETRPAPAAKKSAPAKRSPVRKTTAGADVPISPKAKRPRAKPAKAVPAKAATVAKSKAATAQVAVGNKAAASGKAAAGPAKKVKVKAVFCIECGEKNPAVAKFCFSCGTRLAAPEG